MASSLSDNTDDIGVLVEDGYRDDLLDAHWIVGVINEQ